MKFSIIIPTYNKVELLKECLESVIKYTDLSDTEIIVVANGCTDGTESYLTLRKASCPQLAVLWYHEALGYTSAINRGIEWSSGEFIILLNNDTQILYSEEGKWVEMLFEPFKDNAEMGITGVTKVSKPELLDKPFLIFFCVMIRKATVEAIGMPDERFNPGYGEDADFCWRALKYGWEMAQVPDGKPLESDGTQYIGTSFPIYHLGTQTFKDISEYPEVVKRNTKIIEERWGEPIKIDASEVNKEMNEDIPKVFARRFNMATKERIFHEDDPENPNKMPKQGLNIERAKTIDGFMLETELLELARLASTAKVFIEIGSWHGRSSAAIVDNLPEGGVLYCIDTWKGTEGEYGAHDSAKQDDYDHAYAQFLYNNGDAVFKGKIIPLRMTSRNAYMFLLGKRISPNVVFIDGDHSYSAVIKDLEMWGTFAKTRCIICGHDYVWDHESVIQAVDEYFGKRNISVFPNTSIWRYEPKKKEEIIIKDNITVNDLSDSKGIGITTEVFEDTFTGEKGNYKDHVPEIDTIKVTVGIPTKDRYQSLAHCLQSIIFQTYKVHEIIIVDDSVEPKDIRQMPIFNYLLGLAFEKGIQWYYFYGQKKGQHYSHQTIQEKATGNWIFRIDDDCCAESTCLEYLVDSIDMLDEAELNIGAVAPLVLSPNASKWNNQHGGNSINILNADNVQWFKGDGNRDSRFSSDHDHLHSCFIYRKGIANYELGLSPVAHREETLFTYKIKRDGYELRVDAGAVVHHFRSETGGIRSHNDESYYHHDEGVFKSLLSLWNANPNEKKVVVLDNGIGDHWAFKNILGELLEKHGTLTISCCYPQVFFDLPQVSVDVKEGIEIISIEDAKNMFHGNIDEFSIYRKMIEWNWKPEEGNLVAAYRKLYLS